MASPLSAQEQPPLLRIEESPQSHRAERLLPWGVFATASAVLGFNAGPGLWFHDSGAFALAVASGGVPHPPGAPTWTLPAWLVSQALPMLDPAFVSNLLCALYAAASLGLLTQLFLKAGLKGPRVLALLPAAVLAGTPAFLEQAFFTEQYTQLLMLNLAILATAPRAGSPKWRWVVSGLLFGLAIGNHLSQAVLAPLMLILAGLAGKKDILQRIGLGAVGLLAGLSVFAYGPLRSAQEPAMDWGRQSEGDGLWWSITRQQWETRPISDAPPGFTLEWIASYNLPGELGWLALGLALLGGASLINKGPGGRLVGLLALAAVPYSVILWLGHLRQAGMDLIYLRHYGVADWHLPIYALGAVMAGLGAIWLATRFKGRAQGWAATALVLGSLGWAGWQVMQNSGRGNSSATQFAESLLAGAPQDSVVFLGSDNPAGVVAYQHVEKGVRPDVFFGFGNVFFPFLQEGRAQWGAPQKQEWLTTRMHERKNQPLRLPKADPGELARRPLIVEYPSQTPGAGQYMTPAGLLFQLHDSPVSQAEAAAADAENRRQHSSLFKRPGDSNPTRLEREAWGNIHLARGRYYLERQMPAQAAEALKMALEWMPDNAMIHYALGFAYDMAGETLAAATAYEECWRIMPDYPGAARALAISLIELGLPGEAKPLLEQAYRTGRDPEAKQILESIRVQE
jgi:hypothetical protein